MSTVESAVFVGVSAVAAAVVALRRRASPDVAKAKDMELYQDAHRIFRDLAEHGIGEADAIPAGLLATLDQYHYLGHEPLDEFIERAGLTPASRVLEVGSGIGGPSRYVAAAAGCAVRALELQDDLNAIGERLTRRCGLARLVTHACGDILGEPAPAGGEAFDALLSVLCFLHVPDKRALFAACRAQLRPDGVMFVEDFVARRPVDASDLTRLKEHVFCTSVPTVEEYTAQLQAAGFGDIKVVDMSDRWTAFTQERLALWRKARDRNVRVHGEACVQALDAFYTAIVELFSAGRVGGVRLSCVRLP